MSQPRVAIVTDSTADIPAGLATERGITVVPLTVTLGGRSYLDGVEITAADFYARLVSSGEMATTSQPAAGRFAEVYGRLLRDHERVLSLHISAKLSGTHGAARQGADLAGGTRVEVVDTKQVSLALSLLVLAASGMAAHGRDLEEILDGLAPIREQTRAYFVVETLEYLRRGGRIGRAGALLGSMLQVKPVLTISDGQVAPLERVRTREKALGRLVELVKQEEGRVCALVAHAAAGEAAQRVADALEPVAETLMVSTLGPVVGAHAGPGTVAVGCYPAELFPLGLRRVSSLAAS